MRFAKGFRKAPVLIEPDQFLQMPKSQRMELISCPGVRPVPGVNDTPRSTSPDLAARSVVKLSLAGSVVALSLSVSTRLDRAVLRTGFFD